MADTQGQASSTDGGSQFNAISFLIKQLMSGMATAQLVQVKAVTNSDDVAAPGAVDVQPMVSQIDGAGNAQPHGTIFSIPYFRLQGGTNAVIVDPEVGDIGVAVFALSDISVVKSTKAVGNPGSRRTFDWADGLYLGGFLNAIPVQWVRFVHGGGLDFKSTGKITFTDGTGSVLLLNNDNTASLTAGTSLTFTAPTINLDGAVVGNSTAEFSGEGTFNGGHTVSAHTHTQPPDSHGDTEQPTNTPTG